MKIKNYYFIFIAILIVISIFTVNTFAYEDVEIKKNDLIKWDGKTVGDASFKVIQNDDKVLKLKVSLKSDDITSTIEFDQKTNEVKIYENKASESKLILKGNKKEIKDQASRMGKKNDSKLSNPSSPNANANKDSNYLQMPNGVAMIGIPPILSSNFTEPKKLYAATGWECIANYHDIDYYFCSQTFRNSSSAYMYYSKCWYDNAHHSKYTGMTSSNQGVLNNFRNSVRNFQYQEQKCYALLGTTTASAIATMTPASFIALIAAIGAGGATLSAYIDMQAYKSDCVYYYKSI